MRSLMQYRKVMRNTPRLIHRRFTIANWLNDTIADLDTPAVVPAAMAASRARAVRS